MTASTYMPTSATFGRLQNRAKGGFTTDVDNLTPAGHFKATIRLQETTVTLLFEGVLGDPDALIKEYHFSGGDIDALLGHSNSGSAKSYKDTFAKMVRSTRNFIFH